MEQPCLPVHGGALLGRPLYQPGGEEVPHASYPRHHDAAANSLKRNDKMVPHKRFVRGGFVVRDVKSIAEWPAS